MADCNKIAIIGSGIFGLSVAEKLVNLNTKIDIYEKNKEILGGATKNNLNRIHQGFHYPRSKKTINQSIKNYKIFVKKYHQFIKKKLKSYYLISSINSKINLIKFLKVAHSIPFLSKKININKFPTMLKNIEGGILTNELIYDWNLMKKYFNKIIKKKNINIYLNHEVKNLNNDNLLTIYNNSKRSLKKYDFVIDCSYTDQNKFKKQLGIIPKKKIFQKTLVLEVKLENFKKIGVAVMDGEFVSLLPKGNSNNFLLYDVKNSIIKKKISKVYPSSFKKKISSKKINSNSLKIIRKFKYFFPELKIKEIISFKISDRVLNITKNDSRTTNVEFYKNRVFFVNQGKTDHCIEVSENIYKKIKKFNEKKK
jgi:hypothetical protein